MIRTAIIQRVGSLEQTREKKSETASVSPTSDTDGFRQRESRRVRVEDSGIGGIIINLGPSSRELLQYPRRNPLLTPLCKVLGHRWKPWSWRHPEPWALYECARCGDTKRVPLEEQSYFP